MNDSVTMGMFFNIICPGFHRVLCIGTSSIPHVTIIRVFVVDGDHNKSKL